MQKVLILGAGPAGISAAHRFRSEGWEVVLIERRDAIGGLGASFKWHDFYLDFGPHAFHPKPSKAMDNISALFKDKKDQLIFQDRSERLLLRNRLFQYPLKLWELAFRLNPFYSLRLLWDFFMANLIYRYIAVPDDNFEAWCIKRFGKSLYRMCFGNYTEKVWGMSPAKISPKFARQKIHKLSLKDLIKKLLGGRGEEQENYWNDLCYTRYGSGQLFDVYGEELKKLNIDIRVETQATSFQFDGQTIKSATLSHKGREETIACDLVISTIPLQYLTRLCSNQISDYARYKSEILKFRALVLVFIEFDQPNVSGVHWIYLLDPRYKSNRYTEQKNMSPDTCPPERSVLCFEKSCNFQDDIWRLSDDEVFKRVLEEDIKINPLMDASKVRRYTVSRIRHAYPIYDIGFERNLRVVLDSMAKIQNLYTTGRQGLFLQNDQHGSMIMGWEIFDYVRLDDSYAPWRWYQSILKRWDMD